jgi:hypothetical protein
VVRHNGERQLLGEIETKKNVVSICHKLGVLFR